MRKQAPTAWSRISPRTLSKRRRHARARADLLESRYLLSISAGEYDALRSTYPSFNLPADIAQVNLVEITPEQLSIASLKAAITTAAGTALPDLVVLRTTDTQHTIAFTSAADTLSMDIPSAQGSTSIVALGSQPLTLDGQGYAGVLTIGSTGSTTRVNLGNLHVTGGNGPEIVGTLWVYGVPRDGAFGGIYQVGGTVSLDHMNISGNAGTGLYQGSGTLAITNSIFRENRNRALYQNDGSASLANIIIQRNSSTADNGGFSVGAGICQTLGTMTLTNATVVDNFFATVGPTDFPQGGGIYTFRGLVTLNNSIVARNISNSGADITYGIVGTLQGTITGSNNLIGDGAGIAPPWSQPTLGNGTNGNIVGSHDHPIDPLLAEGTAFGAGVALLPGSPAAGKGNVSLLPANLTTDIYGNPRIQDGKVNIGAVQSITPLTPGVTYIVNSLDDSLAADGQLTLREALAAANSAAAVGDAPAGSYSSTNRIEFAPGLTGTIATHGQAYRVLNNLDLIGPGTDNLILDAQGTSSVLDVIGQHTVSLQQFTVTGGYVYTGELTAGIRSVATRLSVDGLNITGNVNAPDPQQSVSATPAVGLHQYMGSLSLSNSTLSRNIDPNDLNSDFDAVYAASCSSVLANVTISENPSGMTQVNGPATLTNVTMRDNLYDGLTAGEATLDHVLITGCVREALACPAAALTDVVLSNNGRAASVGGINTAAVLKNVIISGNGGWAHEAVNAQNTTMINVIITGNRQRALSCNGGNVILADVTITNNNYGIAVGSTTSLTMNNTIVAGSTHGPDIVNLNGSTIPVPISWLHGTNNLIGDGSMQSSFVNGSAGNLVGTAANPLDPMLAEGVTFGIGQTPLTGSPVIGKGRADKLDPADIYGHAPDLARPNIGAVQNVLAAKDSVTYVVNSLEDSLAADGKLTLREALAAANSNLATGDAPAGSWSSPDHIVFAPGLTGTISTHGQAYWIESDLDITGPGTDKLILDGQASSRVLEIHGFSDVALKHFTVRNGRAPASGGGIRSFESHVTIEDLAISANATAWYPYPYLDYGGGGIYASGGVVTVSNSRISGNTSLSDGGGIFGCDALTNVIISGNSATWHGGGIYISSGDGIVMNNVAVVGNNGLDGAGVYCGTSAIPCLLTNVTITGNTASRTGGGLYGPSDGSMHVNNSIIAGNAVQYSGYSQSTDVSTYSGTIPTSNSLIGIGSSSVSGGSGNLMGTQANPLDPKFVDVSSADPTQWDLHLRPDSPAIDAGSNALIPAGLSTDLDGHPRIAHGTVDMGAYELYSAPTLTSVSLNDGAIQRSMVKKLAITFSEPVTLASDAIALKFASGAAIPNLTLSLSSSDQQLYLLTFAGPSAAGGSLPDGIYDLTITASGVQNSDGNPLTATYTQRFHRLFGDVDGNKVVNALDYAKLKASYGRSSADPLFNAALDYEGNGVINALDLAQFRKRYGQLFIY